MKRWGRPPKGMRESLFGGFIVAFSGNPFSSITPKGSSPR